MRITLLSLLVAAVAVGGCNKVDATTPATTLAVPAGGDVALSSGTARPSSAWREITIPAGTQLRITLDTAVGSDTSRIEEPVVAHVSRSVLVQGLPVLPEGSRVGGVVTDATPSAKVKGLAHVAVRFDSITPGGDDQRYDIRTASVGRTAQGTKGKDALEIGGAAAGGAIIGALFGGKKGAAIGTAVGGGGGTAVVLSTRGKEIHLLKGAPLTLELTAPVTVRVRS